MSFFYAESNNENAKDLFEKRVIYRGAVAGSVEYTNLVDFNFGEKYFYGRTNRLFVPITINEAFLGKKYFKTSTANLAINFVVDAFEALAAQYNKCADTGNIDVNDTYLSRLIVHKAWVDPNTMYDDYLVTYTAQMKKALRTKAVKVRNFDGFLNEVTALLKASAYTIPFTKPAFIKSRRCPINCSGLAVEIADLDAANDQNKIDQFVSSPNWEFYVNACRSFGFMVDQFVPWRLVADIASTPMLDFANEYNFTTTDQILELGYGRVHSGYFSRFKFYLLNLYNNLKLESFVEPIECNGVVKTQTVTPQVYSIEQLSALYSEGDFLEIYFNIRFLEEESQFQDFEKEMLIDDCLEIYEARGIGHALEAFERILNKPFDYRGSLSYIKEYLEIISAEPT